MRTSIKEILSNKGIIDPKLLEELTELYNQGLRSAKQFGKRSIQLTETQETMVWQDIKRNVEAALKDETPFNSEGLSRLREDYGLYKRK